MWFLELLNDNDARGERCFVASNRFAIHPSQYVVDTSSGDRFASAASMMLSGREHDGRSDPVVENHSLHQGDAGNWKPWTANAVRGEQRASKHIQRNLVPTLDSTPPCLSSNLEVHIWNYDQEWMWLTAIRRGGWIGEWTAGSISCLSLISWVDKMLPGFRNCHHTFR